MTPIDKLSFQPVEKQHGETHALPVGAAPVPCRKQRSVVPATANSDIRCRISRRLAASRHVRALTHLLYPLDCLEHKLVEGLFEPRHAVRASIGIFHGRPEDFTWPRHPCSPKASGPSCKPAEKNPWFPFPLAGGGTSTQPAIDPACSTGSRTRWPEPTSSSI